MIGRLGAIPPRKLVEGFGIRFGSKDPTALPELSPTYQSSVPGLYVVGALGGYPLIKQAMNQGYEAVESICGRVVVPADQPLLEKRFATVLQAYPELGNEDTTPLFIAAADATEEAIANSLLMAQTVTSRDVATGETRRALAVDRNLAKALLAKRR